MTPLSTVANSETPRDPEDEGSTRLLDAVDRLKFFLATAPTSFEPSPDDAAPWEDRYLNRFSLPTGDSISCVLWNGLYHITGTDIVRALNFRFLAFGRPVRNVKKFEEGIFSDLRNLKSGTDATLEDPKSDFLELLFKHNCIRTQKKQKVFYWFSVPHDRLFLDALDRDLKREKLGMEATTQAVAEPALSFVYNASKTLYEQFAQSQNERKSSDGSMGQTESKRSHTDAFAQAESQAESQTGSVLGAVSLFEGSPSYKQRRKQSTPSVRRPAKAVSPQEEDGWPNQGGPLATMHRTLLAPPSYLYRSNVGSSMQSAPSLAPGSSMYSLPLVLPDGSSAGAEHGGPIYDNSFAGSPFESASTQTSEWQSVDYCGMAASNMAMGSIFPSSNQTPDEDTYSNPDDFAQRLSPSPGLVGSATSSTVTSTPVSSYVMESSSSSRGVWFPAVSPRYVFSTEQGAAPLLLRSGSVDPARASYDHYPIARRHRSATPVMRRNRVSVSHPTFAARVPRDSGPAAYNGTSGAMFSDHLQAISSLSHGGLGNYSPSPSTDRFESRFETGYIPVSEASPTIPFSGAYSVTAKAASPDGASHPLCISPQMFA